MEKSIVLRGIERNMSVSNGVDGGMAELVGWRHVDGNLRPATGLSMVNVSLRAGDRLLYVHRYGVYEHYIIWDSNGDLVYRERGGSAVLIEQEVRSVRQVVSIGHSIVVTTDIAMRVWVWGDERYKLVSDLDLPYIPIQKVITDANGDSYDVSSARIDIIPDAELGNYSDLIGSAFPTYIKNKYMRRQLTEQYAGLLADYRHEASLSGLLVDSYLVRYGLRMYDGNYMYVSPPIYVQGEAYELICESAKYNTSNANGVWEVLQGCHVAGSGYKLQADMSNLYSIVSERSVEGIVVALDIFLSRPIAMYDNEHEVDATLRTEVLDGDGMPQFYKLYFGSASEKRSMDIEQYFNSYRVFSVPIDSVKSGSVEVKIDERIDNIVQLPLLENDTSIHKYVPQYIMTYNGRLHMGNVEEKLFRGYPLNYYSYQKGDAEKMTSDGYEIYVYIRDGSEEYVVKSEIKQEINSILSPYISYPDSRAYKMVIYTHEGDSYFRRILELRQHPYSNESYYYAGFGREALGLYGEELTEAEYNAAIGAIELRGSISRRNVIKVSELHNAMLYGNDKTYTVGNGAVVAMAVATKAISEGQFGQYPLYVFSEDGVYALLSGSGEVLYGNIAPVSRHVVERAGMVCGIDDAVVFGTRQGIFVLVGGEARKISNSLDDHGVRLTGNRSLHAIVEAFAGVTLSTRSMREVIREGMLGYDYVNNELLLYVPGDAYCYAYSFAEQLWHSYEYGVQYTVENYPNLHIVCGVGSSSAVYEPSDEDSGITQDSMLLVTQPMTLGDAMNVKKLERIHLLSHIKGDGENCVMKIGMAVSNDGESWKLVWDRTMNVVTLHNVTLPHVASAYRYFSLMVYIPEIEKNSYINSMYVEYETMRMER